MIGAAIAAAFTSLVSQLFLYYYGMKVFPLEVNNKKLLKLYLILCVFTFPAYFLYALEINIFLKLLIKSFGIYLFILICFKNNFINKNYIISILKDYNYLNKTSPIINFIF